MSRILFLLGYLFMPLMLVACASSPFNSASAEETGTFSAMALVCIVGIIALLCAKGSAGLELCIIVIVLSFVACNAEAAPIISRDHQAVATLIILLVVLIWIVIHLLIRPVAVYYIARFTQMGRDGRKLGEGLSFIFCILMCMFTINLLQG